MAITPKKLNVFLMFKVPAAWICGVRIKEIETNSCKVGVRHTWINQNPFNSMYFAVQAMAAELSTGTLVMREVKRSGENIFMLVKHNKATFTKKATGKISFECTDGSKAKEAIQKSIETGEGEVFWMKSIGKNEAGLQVAEFDFEWTVKRKQQ